jgi:hypothetical protein
MNRKAVLITGTAFYFAGRNESCSVGNKRIQFWNQSWSMQSALTELQMPANVERRKTPDRASLGI